MQGNGQFASRLHQIHMHPGTCLMRRIRQRTHRLNHPGFVVCPGKAGAIVPG